MTFNMTLLKTTVAVILSLFLLTELAFAHAYLQSSKPPLGALLQTPPDQIELNYSEAIERKFSEFKLYDSLGAVIEELEAHLSSDSLTVVLHSNLLATGTFTLAWKVVSAVDGHLTKGTFPLVIDAAASTGSISATGTTAPPLSWPQAAIRWLQFLAAMSLVGGLFFALLVLGGQQFSQLLPKLFNSLKLSLYVFIAAALADLLFQATTLSESSIIDLFAQGTLAQLLFGTRYGYVWLFKLVTAVALGFWLFRRRSPVWGHGLLGALLLFSLSLSSHSAALSGDVALAIFSDWGHLMAVSFWVGGLIQFSLLLLALRPIEPAERTALLASITPRFYQLAFIAAALVLLTGFHLTYRHMANLDAALFSTPYGQVYFIKHLVLLGLVLLSAANLVWVWPRSNTASLRILRLEAVIAAVILFFGGLLTLLPPAQQAAANADSQRAGPPPLLLVRPAEELTVAVTISPGAVGLNKFDAYLSDHEGKPVNYAQRVTFTFYLADADLGEVSSVAQSQGDGHYVVEGSYISMPGQWEIGVTARFAGRAEDVKTGFQVVIRKDGYSLAPGLSPEAMARLESGKALYQQHCMSCHGEKGRGDGPEAASLAIKPADIIMHLGHHTDESLLFIIQTGRLPVMQPFGAKLTEEEIGQIILYLKALSQEQR